MRANYPIAIMFSEENYCRRIKLLLHIGIGYYTPFEEEGVYRSHCVGLSVCRLVGRKPYFDRPISYKPLGGIQYGVGQGAV